MDKFIDARFERLEKALSNLIDSVTKYHPSPIHAEELKAADEELTKGLEKGNTQELIRQRVDSVFNECGMLIYFLSLSP